MLLELPDPVLEVLVVSAADELDVRHRALARRHDDQSPSIVVVIVAFQVQRGQREEGLFRDGAQPFLHLRIPASVIGELGDELKEVGQGVDVKLRFEAHTPLGGKLQEQDHYNRGQPSSCYSAFQQRSPNRAQVGEGDQIELESRAYPEGDPCDQKLLSALLSLNNRSRAFNEQSSRNQDEISGHDGAGYAAQQAGRFGQERQCDEDAADAVPDSVGCDAGDLGEGDDARIDGVGHRPRDTSKQIARARAGQRPLHLSEVDSLGLAPGDPLEGDGFSIHLDGDDDAEEKKRWEQCPERDTEVDSQTRPLAGKPHPSGLRHPADVEYAERRRDDAADGYADHRGPEAPYRRAAEDERGDDDESRKRGQRRRHGLFHRRFVEQTENDGSQGDGENHHYRAADGWRDDSPQNEEPLGDDYLEYRRGDDQRRQCRWPAIHHRVDAEWDGEGRCEQGKNGPGADGAEPPHLQQRRQANDDQRGEDHPRQVRLAPPRCVGHNDWSHQQRRRSNQAELQAEAQGGQEGRVFVGLVAGVLRSWCRQNRLPAILGMVG